MRRRTTGFILALLALTVLLAACDRSAPRASTATPAATASAANPSSSTAAPTATLVPSGGTPSAAPSASGTPAASGTPPRPPVSTPAPPPDTPRPTGTPAATPVPSATPPPTAPPPVVAHVTVLTGVAVRLAQGVVADLPGGRTLALVDVTADSRCPTDVQCIWAGEANLVFEWTRPGTTQRVPVVVSPTRGSTELPGGVTLRALELTPTPTSGRTLTAADYVVTVVLDPGTASSGALGGVTVGPSCPVQREGVPCPDRPLAATLLFRNAAGVEVARALSDATGFYSVALPPGHYTVVPFTPGGATLPRGAPRDIDVSAGDWVVANVMYDSGIR